MDQVQYHGEINVDQMDDLTPNPTAGLHLQTEKSTNVRQQLEDVVDKGDDHIQESIKEEWNDVKRAESPTDNNEETNQALDGHQEPLVNIEQLILEKKLDENEAVKMNETLMEEIGQMRAELRQMRAELQQMRAEIEQFMSQMQQQNTIPTTNIIQCSRSKQKFNGMHSVMMTGQTIIPVDVAANLEVHEWNVKDIQPQPHYLSYYLKESDVFMLPGYNVGAKVVLCYKYKTSDGFIESHLYLHLGSHKNAKKAIGSRALPKFTCVIKDLSNGSEKRDMIGTKITEFQKLIKFENHVGEWETFDHFLCPPYMQNNCLKIAILIEPQSVAQCCFSNDGVLDWTVDNYTSRKQKEADGLVECQESPYFYTSPKGYRVQLTLSLTKSKAQLLFLTGNFDSTLSNKFSHRVTLTIVNQDDQSKSLAIKKDSKMPESTSFNLGQASTGLETYVKDDALLLRATVVGPKCSTRFWFR